MKGKQKRLWKCACSLVFAFCMLFTTVMPGLTPAMTAYAAEIQTQSDTVEEGTIAEWNYTKDTIPATLESCSATAGSGTLSISGAAYTGYSGQGIAANNWTVGGGWLISVNAADYKELKFSASMRSSGTGPRNFNLRYSLDGTSWNEIENSAVSFESDTKKVVKKYDNFSLPEELNGKNFTLRVTMTDNASVKGEDVEVATTGVSNINNIIVSGTKTGEVTPGGDSSETPEGTETTEETETTETPEEKICEKVTASVAAGEVEAGTKVALATATEDAKITYHTSLDETEKEYTSEIEITEDVTIFATAEKDGYTKSETAEFAYTVKKAETKSYPLVTELSDGNIVALYAVDKYVLTEKANGKKLTGEKAEVTDNMLSLPETAAALTVSVDEDGYYTFKSNGKYLTSQATGSGVSFADAASDYSLWQLEAADENGNFFIKNVNAAYNGTKNQYLEYYNGFTTYRKIESSASAYTFQFYLIDKGTPSVNIKADTSITEKVAQWAGNANYDEEGVTPEKGIPGDVYVTNDLKDSDAAYTVTVNGKKDKPYTSATSSTTSSVSYYMGATGLGSGTDDYAQFEFPSTGYANLVMSFRLRASSAGAGSFQMQYSTNGTDFKNLSSGTYSYKYTKYVNNEPSEVSDEGKITDGIAKTSMAAANYINFTFDIPNEAANADKLYIRLVPGTKRADGKDGSLDSKSTVRIDSVVFTANPVISSDQCGYVTAEPEEGAVMLGSEVTLSSATEGAEIRYSVNGGEEKVYDAANKPKLDTLPATISAYAVKDGFKNSIVRSFSYEQAQVASIKATPNGGSVALNSAVTLTCETEGAVIQYSTDDGGNWTNYEGKIILSTLPATYKVKAVKDGYLDSPVQTLVFTERANEKYNIYFGQLHSHTSYSDGAGSCEEAYQHATNVGNLDFLAVTDHSNSFDNADAASITDGSMSEEWTEGHELATKYTTDTFVGIFGFEMTWSNGLGHMNTFNTDGFQSRTQTAYSTYSTALQNYYATLKTVPDSISQFNHPGTTFGDFSDFAYYDEDIDKLVTTIEVGNGEGTIGSSGYFPSYEYYQRALDKGWHVAPTNNQDNHKGLWGDANTARSVVLADSLTQDNIYDAMRNYRVYATEDNDLSIYYTLDGYIMGSILEDGQTGEDITLKVELSDPTDAAIGTVQVITNGGLVLAEKNVTSSQDTVTFDLKNDYSFYYIKVVEADGDIAVTAPVWVGEVEAAGINSISTDEVLPVKDEALTVDLELYNNENSALDITDISFEADGKVIHKADLEAAGLTSVASMSTADYSFDYTYDGVGSLEINAIVTASLNGVSKVYKAVLKLNYVTPEMVTRVIIDGTHYNDYVTGYYGGNLGNFTAIAGKKNVKVEVVKDEITPEMLENCALLVISAPAKKTGTANAGDYTVSHFSDDFIQMVKNYTDNGGTLITCGIADYQDTTSGQTATEMNKLLAAIGATTKLNSDEAYDEVNNGGQAYRLYLKGTYNKESRYLAGASEEQEYSAYSGCTVNLDADAVAAGKAEALVSGYDTTYSIDCKDENGKAVTGSPVYVEKGNVVTLAHETLDSGANIFVAGTVFISDFEVKAELDNIWDLPYLNRTIAENILDEVTVQLPLSDISEVRKNGKAGDVYRVEGYVTAGTDVEENKFFDTIYIQDDTAGIDIFPYAEAGLALGTKVQIVGYVDAYQGDKELKIISSKVLSDEPAKVITPAKMSAKDAMDYEKSGGSLVQVEGTVTDVLYDTAGTGVSQFWLQDENGDIANIFIDGYILSATTGKNELASVVAKGKKVSAVGVVYNHPEGDSDEPVTCLRVRNCDEIVAVSSADTPSSDDNNGNSNAGNDNAGSDNAGNSSTGNDNASDGSNTENNNSDNNNNTSSDSNTQSPSTTVTADVVATVTVTTTNDWQNVKNAVAKTQAGKNQKIKVTAKDNTMIPADVLKSLKGKDCELVVSMPNGVTWTINGKSMTADEFNNMDLGVVLNQSDVPAALAEKTADGKDYMQMSLNYDGAFGFEAVLTIPTGSNHAGMYAKLYYYNEATGRMEYVTYGKVDANGKVDLKFVHASDYIIVFDSIVPAATGDQTPFVAIILLVMAGVLLIATALRKKISMK